MLKKLTTLALSATLFTFGASALAAKPGFYLGGKLGYSDMQINGNYYNGFDGFSAGFNLGYDFKIASQFQLGPEIEYNYMGSFDNSDDSIAALNLFVTGRYSFNPQWDGIAKVGITREIMYGDDYSIAHSNFEPVIAVGLAYNFNPNWDINLQYTHIFGKSVDKIIAEQSNSAITFDTIMLGVNYHFG